MKAKDAKNGLVTTSTIEAARHEHQQIEHMDREVPAPAKMHGRPHQGEDGQAVD